MKECLQERFENCMVINPWRNAAQSGVYETGRRGDILAMIWHWSDYGRD